MLTKKNVLPNIALIFLFLVQACAPSLPIERENTIALPQDFPNRMDAPTKTSTADVAWKEFFHDPQLAYLIDEALKHNQELNLLEQEINIANNEIMARQGEYLPKIGMRAGGGVEKAERFSTEDANSVTKSGNIGLTATWELDIWKKLRNASKAAYFNYLGTIEGRRFMVTSLVAEIANTYFELMALDNQMEIIDSYIKVLTQIKGMVVYQQKAARVTSLAVKRFEAEVYKNQSRKYKILQQIILTQNKMNVLIGRFPQEVFRDSKKFSEFTFSKIKASVPTHLLDHRPDVKKATLDLEAAKLNVKVAKARFYPSLSIDGGVGYEQFNSKHFEDPATTSFYGLMGNITAPLLNRKAIKADYFSANNKQIQAVFNYELTLIKAYTDVANQLTKLKNLSKIYDLKVKQVAALTESINISNILFRAARVDYIEALFTQRDALEAQVELVEIKKQQLSASVNLYKALGGGWKGLDEKYESEY